LGSTCQFAGRRRWTIERYDAAAPNSGASGRTVKICAEPSCPVHFADCHAPNPLQLAKEREQRRKELEKRKLEITVRHRILAEVLKKVSSPMDRADLILAAEVLLRKAEPMYQEALA
jgi:ParB family chromosome partitioning protein